MLWVNIPIELFNETADFGKSFAYRNISISAAAAFWSYLLSYYISCIV